MAHMFFNFKISFVIPVLNSERLLSDCLASIRRQDIPAADYEILIADGGSRDRSVEVAQQYGCRMLAATGLMAEAAKRMAFDTAGGEYIALLDADNEIAGCGWLRQALVALERHPEALGFESYYIKHSRHTRLNRYLTGCLQISDPYARFLAGALKLQARDADGTEVFTLPANGSYPTGANGFLFHRRLLAHLPAAHGYHEAVFFPQLMRAGHRVLLKHPACGVHHHYVTTWGDYFRKRQRAMIIYMLRREETMTAWEGAWRAAMRHDPDWLLHPLAGVVSTLGNSLGVLRYKFGANRAHRIALTQALHNKTNPPS
ncbi:MAG: glycosyltransferase family 2 protein [Kiritimatiellaeota bacterium]|nr:glycosyltransferase family 2 protein [Kiritimatiellota bacterium]